MKKYAIKKDTLYLQGVSENKDYVPRRFTLDEREKSNSPYNLVWGESEVRFGAAVTIGYLKALLDAVDCGKEKSGSFEITVEERKR